MVYKRHTNDYICLKTNIMIRKASVLLMISLIFFIKISAFSQELNPTLLLTPEDWKYEKIDFPLDFAPDIDFDAYEELRFAPGMFDTLSPTYFTYVFAISISNKDELTENEIKHFLSRYYKGLCIEVAKPKSLSIDTSKIETTIAKQKETRNNTSNYRAQINFFDVFTNGQEVLLNIDIEIISDIKANKLYMLALVSPQLMTEKIWQKLYEIRDDAKRLIKH